MNRAIVVMSLCAPWSLVLVGCGGSSPAVAVTGKLIKNRAPYVPPNDQRLGVTLIAMEILRAEGKVGGNDEPYPAVVNPADGTFTVPGPDGRGVPPGKYRIAVVQKWKREALPQSKPGDRNVFDRDTDLLKDRFSAADSPIIREFKASGDVTIDLDSPIERTAPQ
jgi:hypothetical protein